MSDKFFTKTHCDRCGKPLAGSRTMSMYDTATICLACADAERKRPDYEAAREAERAAVARGDRNFKGVGWPCDGGPSLRDELVRAVVGMNRGGPIGEDYVRAIAEVCADDVAEDIGASADPLRWNDDDVRLAFGRVLAKRLGASA